VAGYRMPLFPEFVPALQPQADSWIPPNERSSQEELDERKLNSQNSYPHCSHKQIPRSRPRSKNADLLFSCRISIENAFYERRAPQTAHRPPTPPQNLPFCRINHSTPQRAGITVQGERGRMIRASEQGARDQRTGIRGQR